jgi:hypothetical protein
MKTGPRLVVSLSPFSVVGSPFIIRLTHRAARGGLWAPQLVHPSGNSRKAPGDFEIRASNLFRILSSRLTLRKFFARSPWWLAPHCYKKELAEGSNPRLAGCVFHRRCPRRVTREQSLAWCSACNHTSEECPGSARNDEETAVAEKSTCKDYAVRLYFLFRLRFVNCSGHGRAGAGVSQR